MGGDFDLNYYDQLQSALDEASDGGANPYSDEWKELRLGKFTSSTCNKLFKGGKGGKIFGDGAESYIYKTIAETLTREANEVSSAAIKWGEEYEEDAVKQFENLQGKSVIYYGKKNPLFIPYVDADGKDSEHAGGSPDGFVEAENAVIETKCPYESRNHAEVLHKVVTKTFDLRKYNEDYFGQVQMNIMLTKADFGYFISYDPRCCDYKFSVAVARIEKDEKYIAELKVRLSAAIALKVDFLKQLGYC